MSESEKKVDIKGPNLPLEPVVASDDPEYAEIKAAYDTLLAECRRIDEIKSSQVDGESWSLDKEKRIYSVDEYNEMLAAYKASRKAYIERYKAKLETIDMVREKIRKIEEEEEQFDKNNPIEDDPPEVPDFEDIPDESWESFSKRNKEYWDKLQASMDKTMKQMELGAKRSKFVLRRLEEIGKFAELEYEMAFRLRHTYIDPKTGESEYRPNDDVGEGLICIGSRDYNPKREDFDD